MAASVGRWRVPLLLTALVVVGSGVAILARQGQPPTLAQLGPAPPPPPVGARDPGRRAAAALEIVASAMADPTLVSESVHPWLWDQLRSLERAAQAAEDASRRTGGVLETNTTPLDTAIDHAMSAAESIATRASEPDATKAKLLKLGADLKALTQAALTPAPFVAPVTGRLYLRCVGGSAGAKSTVGLGNSPDTFRSVLSDLPASCPSREIAVGSVKQGERVQLGIETTWNGLVYWAFAGGQDHASMVSFTDTTNSLGLNGAVAKPVATNTWVLHLNDAAHYTLSDAEADNLLIQVRIAPEVATAPPGRPTEPFVLFAQESGKCVDAVPGTASPTPLTQETCSNRASQRWKLKTVAGGYEIVSASDPHACLHLRDATMAQGARVWFSACSEAGQLGEVWSVEDLGNGAVALMAKHSSKCLNVSQDSAADGAAILQWTCLGSPNEKFLLSTGVVGGKPDRGSLARPAPFRRP